MVVPVASPIKSGRQLAPVIKRLFLAGFGRVGAGEFLSKYAPSHLASGAAADVHSLSAAFVESGADATRAITRRRNSNMSKPEQLSKLDEEAWALWVDYRKRIIKIPLNPDNYENTQRGLRRFGENQMAVVQQSMEKEWRGLFPLKDAEQVNMNFDPSAPW